MIFSWTMIQTIFKIAFESISTRKLDYTKTWKFILAKWTIVFELWSLKSPRKSLPIFILSCKLTIIQFLMYFSNNNSIRKLAFDILSKLLNQNSVPIWSIIFPIANVNIIIIKVFSISIFLSIDEISSKYTTRALLIILCAFNIIFMQISKLVNHLLCFFVDLLVQYYLLSRVIAWTIVTWCTHI